MTIGSTTSRLAGLKGTDMSIKQAIEALEELIEYAETAGFDWSLDNARAALAALRSMPQGEPVPFEVRANINGPYNACMYREHCRAMLAATPHAEAVDRSEKIPLLIPSNPGELTEAVRMSEAELKAMRTAAREDPRCVDVLWYILFARAVEQATAARLGVKMGDV